jgi:hypothetical protein
MSLRSFYSDPTKKFTVYQALDKDAKPIRGQQWIVKQVEDFQHGTYFVFTIENPDGNKIIVNNDLISQDYFINRIVDSILASASNTEDVQYQKNICPYLGIYYIDDYPNRVAIAIPEEYSLERTDRKLFNDGLDIHNCLTQIMSFDKTLEQLGYSLHHGNLTYKKLTKVHETWVINSFSHASLCFQKEEIVAYPALAEYQTAGACNIKHIIDYTVSSDSRYYSFSNPNQYLFECKRGTIGRLAFSESRAFRTIDIYLLVVSICCDIRYRNYFFSDSVCLEIWNCLWSSDRISNYPEIVKQQLFASRYHTIDNDSDNDNPDRLLNLSLNFLANRPLKTFFSNV